MEPIMSHFLFGLFFGMIGGTPIGYFLGRRLSKGKKVVYQLLTPAL